MISAVLLHPGLIPDLVLNMVSISHRHSPLAYVVYTNACLGSGTHHNCRVSKKTYIMHELGHPGRNKPGQHGLVEQPQHPDWDVTPVPSQNK